MSSAGIELSTSDGPVLVFLGPHIYVDFQNFRINVGNHVGVIGVWATGGERSIFIAGEVRKGDDMLKLRDDNGAPVWEKEKTKRGISWN